VFNELSERQLWFRDVDPAHFRGVGTTSYTPPGWTTHLRPPEPLAPSRPREDLTP